MPIYERKCRRCKVVYKVLCKWQDRKLPDTCPGCDCPDTDLLQPAPRTTFRFADRKLK